MNQTKNTRKETYFITTISDQSSVVSSSTPPLIPGQNISLQTELNNKIIPHLTTREIDIIHCLLEGKTAKETARQLFISHRTVERHLENIKLKLNCRNKFGLINKILTLAITETRLARKPG